jgi:serine/threonine protein kinase
MAPPVRVGDILAQKYEVTRVLGAGGMGVVVAARHLDLDKLVALKFMHDEISMNAQAAVRFLREARAAAQLSNEHVGRVLDVGRLPDGVPYIVMEYLEGRDLAAVCNERGPLPISDVAEYMLQVCEAMAEAHAKGIVHRDLKPQNLFLTSKPDGRPLVKVVDFGISKSHAAKGAPTTTAQSMGSPSYMAPEQMRSAKNVDARADIWSMGVILYELLSGKLPFEADTMPELIVQVLGDTPPPSLAQLRDGLPPALVRTVEKCLEKDRERRFATVAELAHELVLYAPDRGRAALSVIERVVNAAAEPPRREPDGVTPAIDDVMRAMPAGNLQTTLSASVASGPTPEPRHRRRYGVVIGVAGAAIVAVSIAVFATRGDDRVQESAPVVEHQSTSTRSVARAPAIDEHVLADAVRDLLLRAAVWSADAVAKPDASQPHAQATPNQHPISKPRPPAHPKAPPAPPQSSLKFGSDGLPEER